MVAKKPRVVIIGAGMAGLTAAHRLHTAPSGDLLDICIVEAGDRIGGRILTDDFGGARVEMGATWIQGINGSPIYDIAKQTNSLDDSNSWERMDGYPSNPITIFEGGNVVDNKLIVEPITSLYCELMDSARRAEAKAVDLNDPGVGPFLRRGLKEYRAGGSGSGETTLEDAVFAMHVNEERVTTSADNIDELDLAAEAEYRDYPGEHITVPKGYSTVVQHLAAALPPGTILFGRRLRCVEWCADGVAKIGDSSGPVKLHIDSDDNDHRVMSADHVIITVSLGVLKASLVGDGGLVFKPALPPAKRDAIMRLGFGVVDKVFMEIDDKDREDFPFVQLGFSADPCSATPRWMRRTVSIFPIFGGSRVLLAWIVGKEATELETLTDDDVIRDLHTTLQVFGLPSRVSRVKRSGWSTDPLFLGSYSYVAVGSSGDDLDAMSDPLSSLQLLFAGEATHRTHYSTTHGAYLSGIREANRLLKHYGLMHTVCCLDL